MSDTTDNNRGRDTVPLQRAVLCIECETVSRSPHDRCPICGSRSLFSLCRLLGGTLFTQTTDAPEEDGKATKYDLEISIKVSQMAGKRLNEALDSITNLVGPKLGGVWESFHINVESAVESRKDYVAKAA